MINKYYLPKNPNSIVDYNKIQSEKDVLNKIELTHRTKRELQDDNILNDIKKTDIK